MTRARDIADGLGAESGEVVPHIKLDVLYPAVAGKLLDGSTSHSGNYGTAQSDGRSYYYTSIKGSKPIKDSRIGAYFGSQRHMIKSLQVLEQETATHGENIYSVDGREWMRVGGGYGGNLFNNDWGNYIGFDANGEYIEFTGYFNNINLLIPMVNTSAQNLKIEVNGVTAHASLNTGGSAATPLSGRYVDAHSVVNIDITSASSLSADTPLAINTIKVEKSGGADHRLNGIELIAQDTSSTANKSKIQIPAQTVVSYGKKHSISATAEHYDPFNGFVDDTTLFSAKVDTATSLGLGTATTWGASWDTGSDNHIRPFNGGRVIKWIDSSGNIKTSVTMMPRNAQNIGSNTTNGSAGTASNEITDVSSTNSHTINFSDDVIDNGLSEVATTLMLREFGNGAANGGTLGTYADVSMLDGNDNVTYVMDDGLTSFTGDTVECGGTDKGVVRANQWGSDLMWTFIGTGISMENGNTPVWVTIAQNLPYGTHVLHFKGNDSDDNFDVYLDGVEIATNQTADVFHTSKRITIHQPKKPPVPESACIIADYMLTADYVRQTSSGIDKISKGVRRVNASRDMFYNEDTNATFSFWIPSPFASSSGYAIEGNTTISSGNMFTQLPYFGTDVVVRTRGDRQGTDVTEYINSTTLGTITKSATSATYGEYIYAANTPVLGLNGCKVNASSTSPSRFFVSDLEINTPIHTSSHYQTFETPYLKELTGGDRNMEQTNLVVTSDGKTWDSVTRDTSYLGNICVTTTNDTSTVWANSVIFDEWRGNFQYMNWQNKDFAIAYDRVICLVDGQYRIHYRHRSQGGGETAVYINGTSGENQPIISKFGASGSDDETRNLSAEVHLKRGDFVLMLGEFGTTGNKNYHGFQITRL